MKFVKQLVHLGVAVAIGAFALSANAQYKFIDSEKALVGLEPTFQDQGMVDERGRLTWETPHKREKFEKMIKAFLASVPNGQDAKLKKINDAKWKPGYKILIPGMSPYFTTMEPVCVEWNNDPQRVYNLAKAWKPTYSAAQEAGLVAYVNPAAERSGMGHAHIGGDTIGDNPFFKSPTLLRNTFAYFHQHPSLLWGFAEAYDIGVRSNIETHHLKTRQEALARTIKKFDEWYRDASAEKRVDGGFIFLKLLYEYGGDTMFEHYRFINLEHVKRLITSNMKRSGGKTGKFTVEFRNFRPFKTPEHAQAVGELLFGVLDQLADPKLLVPFHRVSQEEYTNFHSVSVVRADWERVERDIKAEHNPLWDEMMNEYVTNLSMKTVRHPRYKNMFVTPAYSEKGNKGRYFELLIPVDPKSAEEPLIEGLGTIQTFKKISIEEKLFWVTVIKTNELGIEPEQVLNGRDVSLRLRWLPGQCRTLFAEGA